MWPPDPFRHRASQTKIWWFPEVIGGIPNHPTFSAMALQSLVTTGDLSETPKSCNGYIPCTCEQVANEKNLENLHEIISNLKKYRKLVGGLEHGFYFSIQLGISSSQLTNSFFSEG